jgi:hypothetical protein
MKQLLIRMAVILAFLAISGLVVAKPMNKIKAPNGFDYSMVRTVNVAVDVGGPVQSYSGVSFYTQPKNSRTLRLLSSGVSGPDGRYTGSLVVPSYVKKIIVTARVQDYAGIKKMAIKMDNLRGRVMVR